MSPAVSAAARLVRRSRATGRRRRRRSREGLTELGGRIEHARRALVRGEASAHAFEAMTAIVSGAIVVARAAARVRERAARGEADLGAFVAERASAHVVVASGAGGRAL